MWSLYVSENWMPIYGMYACVLVYVCDLAWSLHESRTCCIHRLLITANKCCFSSGHVGVLSNAFVAMDPQWYWCGCRLAHVRSCFLYLGRGVNVGLCELWTADGCYFTVCLLHLRFASICLNVHTLLKNVSITLLKYDFFTCISYAEARLSYVMLSSPHDSPFILVLCVSRSLRNSDGVTPCGACQILTWRTVKCFYYISSALSFFCCWRTFRWR